MLSIEFNFVNRDSDDRSFQTWRPQPAELRLTSTDATIISATLEISAHTLSSGGGLVFADDLTDQGSETLSVTVATDGTPHQIWVAGMFPHASERYGDVKVEIRNQATNELLASRDTMVRVRKNAESLTNVERDRFLDALAALNGSGAGKYTDFRDMHVAGAPDREAHGGPGFLPWHRAYLLDFERELQAIDPEVSLPYWRFDQAAPRLFNRAFMGVPNAFGQVEFSAGNPLTGWIAENRPGVLRGTGVGPNTIPRLATEDDTIFDGPNPISNYTRFRAMQGNPHGSAHMSHRSGWITNPATAPRDPVFFLLHCNVDRLWAKWQWATDLHDPDDAASYVQGRFNPGHNLTDSLWPWSGPLAPPRPTTAPGGPLSQSPIAPGPNAMPEVHEMVDYLGVIDPNHHGFVYDDVPFQL